MSLGPGAGLCGWLGVSGKPDESLPCQEVEHRIKTTVGAGQWPGDLVRHVDGVEGVATEVKRSKGVVEGAGDVEGQEAEGKDGQHQGDGSYRLALGPRQASRGPVSGFEQPPGHEHVTHQDDCKGHRKEQTQHD